MERHTSIEAAGGEGRGTEGPNTISDSEDGGSWGYGGGGVRGRTIGHVQDLMVGGKRRGAGRPLGTDRSGGERREIDQKAVSEEAAEVVAGAVTATVKVTAIATEATKMT